ncbi:riboflavin synthase [Natronomonas pharaonis DSM 2160]|uniref:Riboflavin synthase n=1 Tax=Natronomonas pharaonis (strain ATCC 35678 / DSM 2160 / CIP 103997 / JCM 8858 / NBRC 14720 / NCIMB 2260 / Gabara) TaxID=348780 RepID=A0A1U7EUU6_NATPD|nr:riboflavin synthase [Natronomonas pharaonis]CAI48769.1 riboflavin synthase [Natronomonas pharaonis DSM 2160]
MFTGIVEATGDVAAVEDTDEGRRIRVTAPFCDELEHGQSVAISGACLTVEAWDDESFELFLSEETLEKTYLDEVAVGDPVNLERALPADGRFDGHFVQGHVDGVAEVTAIEGTDGDDWTFGFSLPSSLAPYVVDKGSIAVDGISLTVAELRADDFSVAVIPATYELTTLSSKSVGDPVHIEVDVVAKYVERLTEGYR